MWDVGAIFFKAWLYKCRNAVGAHQYVSQPCAQCDDGRRLGGSMVAELDTAQRWGVDSENVGLNDLGTCFLQ